MWVMEEVRAGRVWVQVLAFSSKEQFGVVQAPSGGEGKKNMQVANGLCPRVHGEGSGRKQDSRCIHRNRKPNLKIGCTFLKVLVSAAGSMVPPLLARASTACVLLAPRVCARAPHGCRESSPLLPACFLRVRAACFRAPGNVAQSCRLRDSGMLKPRAVIFGSPRRPKGRDAHRT